ncbi:hypothetical protein [Bacillus norwichensis]|uniref:Uncharacterized protein n=1 Tax=Bacillus norwichensis TaxID=2762217 RepID=A0ABR8VKN3_9BACI|nr:hypothetical protein [Bacillus norwichensis]MBD8005322.1 hypothetical protein [Bacillus norwichensis]
MKLFIDRKSVKLIGWSTPWLKPAAKESRVAAVKEIRFTHELLLLELQSESRTSSKAKRQFAITYTTRCIPYAKRNQSKLLTDFLLK